MSTERVVLLDEDGTPIATELSGHPEPDEVMEARSSEPGALGLALGAAPWAYSPWFVRQATELSYYTVSAPNERAHR
ncbi:hypothetical protein [Antribacter gilvus]|uniref:hypothetical protein n=1 Tax=Antribacter gilvus TaxID=2304675 RepID=UPI0013DE9176|nr:hypothetical protein [Antribacter gilvus]